MNSSGNARFGAKNDAFLGAGLQFFLCPILRFFGFLELFFQCILLSSLKWRPDLSLLEIYLTPKNSLLNLSTSEAILAIYSRVLDKGKVSEP